MNCLSVIKKKKDLLPFQMKTKNHIHALPLTFFFQNSKVFCLVVVHVICNVIILKEIHKEMKNDFKENASS